MSQENKILQRLKNIEQEIIIACKTAKREKENVKLIVVSKTIEPNYICEVAKYGQVHFGENGASMSLPFTTVATIAQS